MGYESGARQAVLFLEKKYTFPTCIKHNSKAVTATLKISLQLFIPLNIPPILQKTKICEYKWKV